MGLPQAKRFLRSKGNINKIKRKVTERENIFANTSDKRSISKIYKEFIKLNTEKMNNPIKK